MITMRNLVTLKNRRFRNDMIGTFIVNSVTPNFDRPLIKKNDN